METFRLLCHPESPAQHVRGVSVDLAWRANQLCLVYRVDCSPDLLALPLPQTAGRTDGLWQHTCFEAFIREGKSGYAEFNFSPSGQWAGYDFDNYRDGMRMREMSPPRIEIETGNAQFVLTASFDVTGLSGALAISAVIEEADGTKSYWAVAHAEGRPDFHHGACFAATLPAPNEA